MPPEFNHLRSSSTWSLSTIRTKCMLRRVSCITCSIYGCGFINCEYSTLPISASEIPWIPEETLYHYDSSLSYSYCVSSGIFLKTHLWNAQFFNFQTVPFFDEWDFQYARSFTYKEHPTYDLSIYEPFPGFSNIQSIPFLTATGVVAIGAYVIPLGSFFIIFSISSLIKSHKSMSERTKAVAKMMVKVRLTFCYFMF